jgi:short-subunit dehydrogenase
MDVIESWPTASGCLAMMLLFTFTRFIHYAIFVRSSRSCVGKAFAVTGASGALGSRVCFELCSQGARSLILWDVRAKELDMLKAELAEAYPDVEVKCKQVNLLSLHDLRAATCELSKQNVDCLIQIAGIVFSDSFHCLPSEQDRATMDINFFSQVETLKVLVPSMEATKKPFHVVGVASVAAFNGGAGMAVYAASKAALKGFYESIACELSMRKSCVTVSLFCPGQFESRLFQDASVPFVRSLSPEQVAKALVYQAVLRRFSISIFPGHLSVLFIFSNLLNLVLNAFLIVPINPLANWKGKVYATEVLLASSQGLLAATKSTPSTCL